MIRRTLVVSDLHLGNGGDFDTFAGAEALPALLDKLGHEPIRVVLNGDTTDFLMNEDPLELNVERAVEQAAAIFAAPATSAVLKSLGRIAARGGEVVVRLGNHDIELALGEVQELFRRSMGPGPELASRVRFERGDEPQILEAGGARILISHGEQNDVWNKVDYANLPGPGSRPDARAVDFTYAPGSRLVKTLMNPLKKRYAMRFADLLKPDFQGATLTALAVNPLAVKSIFSGSTVKLLWQLFRQSASPVSFGDGEVDLGLARAIERAQLTEEEQEQLQGLLDDAGAASLAGGDETVLDRARLKLGQAGLGYYARLQKKLAEGTGDRYFDLAPEPEEWKEAQRLAAKYRAGAVVLGHTHAARFRSESPLTFVNTGTWIWLMRLPAADADEAQWASFLNDCRRNPRLDPNKEHAIPLIERFTGALIDHDPAAPQRSGATLSLFQFGPQGLTVLGESHIPAAAEASR